MEIIVLVVSPFQQNCRILACKKTREAVLIDPGDEAMRIIDKIKELELSMQYILATHGHIDHISAAAEITEQLSIPFYMHKAEAVVLDRLPMQAAMFGLPNAKIPSIGHYIEDQEKLSFGDCSCTAIHTPGHSPGSVSFYSPPHLFCGDVLFAGGIGRTDLPGGNTETLKRTLRERIFSLPGETIVHSGHGPETTIAREMEYLSPWVND